MAANQHPDDLECFELQIINLRKSGVLGELEMEVYLSRISLLSLLYSLKKHLQRCSYVLIHRLLSITSDPHCSFWCVCSEKLEEKKIEQTDI